MPLFGIQPANLLQTIFDDVGVAVAVIDNQRRLVFANRIALAMFGETDDVNLVPFQDWCRNYRFEDGLGHEIPVDRSAIMRVLAGEQVEPQDVRVRFPDGETKWLHTSAHGFSAMGLNGVVVIFTDETLEVDLRQAAAQAQRMEAVGVLASGLVHDFNNVLSTISANVELALGDDGGVPEQTRGRLQQIEGASKKAAALVKRLMEFSRTQDLHVRAIQVNELVREILRLVRPLLGDDIYVKTELREGLPDIQADPSQIEQVLVNLVMNAKDAMPQGGELKLSTAVVENDGEPISTREGGRQFVVISVADTGIGIPENLQSVIFEPFFTTKPAGEGTGLGLSSAYGIVRQHNGSLRVQSAPGNGSKFTVYLPVQRLSAPSSSAL